MRKVIITERQLLKIMEDTGPYLSNIDIASEVPGNAYGTEVAVNNMDKDAEDAATITNNVSSKQTRNNRWFARSRAISESEAYDNDTVAGFGKNTDAKINAIANNGGGKMVSNLAKRLNGKGQRLNTTQVEISRMEKDKKENPAKFAANGGKQVLNALKSTEMKQKNKLATTADTSKEVNPTIEIPNVNKGMGKRKENSNEGNIYYY